MERREITRILSDNGKHSFITKQKACEKLNKDRKTVGWMFEDLPCFDFSEEKSGRTISYYIPDVVTKILSCEI